MAVVLLLVDGDSTLLLWTPLWTPLYGKDLGYHNSRWFLIGSTYRPYPKSIPLPPGPRRLPSTPALSHSSTIIKGSLSACFLSCYPKIHCHTQSNLFESTNHILSHGPQPRYLRFSNWLPTTLIVKHVAGLPWSPWPDPSISSLTLPSCACLLLHYGMTTSFAQTTPMLILSCSSIQKIPFPTDSCLLGFCPRHIIFSLCPSKWGPESQWNK